jgi:Transglutaminase-like superfamily
VGPLPKFWWLTRREKRLLCEASILLLVSNLCIWMIPFKRIYSFLHTRYGYRNAYTHDASSYQDDIKLVDLSISRVVIRLPWKNLCLSRSIAAFIMLRRRGIPAVIFTGVKVLEDSSLSAHAWVSTSNEVSDEKSQNSEFTVVVQIGQEPFNSGFVQNSRG